MIKVRLTRNHLCQDAAAADEQQVGLSSRFVEPFGLSQILPRPLGEVPHGGGLMLKFFTPADPRDAEIPFKVSPSSVGPVHLSVRLGDGESLHWTQFVLT